MVTQGCNPNSRGAKAEKLPKIRGQLGLHSKSRLARTALRGMAQ